MANSFAVQSKVPCSSCNQIFNFDLWQLVDVVQRPDFLVKILAGTLHDAYCPHCNCLAQQLDSPLLVYRPRQNPMFIFSSAEETIQEEDKSQFRELIGKLKQNLGRGWPQNWLEMVKAPLPRVILPVFLKEGPEAAEKAIQKLQEQNEATSGELGALLLAFLNVHSKNEEKQILTANFSVLTSSRAMGYLNEIIQKVQSVPSKPNALISKKTLLLHYREIGLEKAIEEIESQEGRRISPDSGDSSKGKSNPGKQGGFFGWVKRQFVEPPVEVKKTVQAARSASQENNSKNGNVVNNSPYMDVKVREFMLMLNALRPEKEWVSEKAAYELMQKMAGNYDAAEESSGASQTLKSRTIVLITGISGPDPEKHNVTNELIFNLRLELAGYEGIRVLSIPQTVSAQQGNGYARKLGEQNKADIVLWGWCEAAQKDVQLTLNLETPRKKTIFRLRCKCCIGITKRDRQSAFFYNSPADYWADRRVDFLFEGINPIPGQQLSGCIRLFR